MFGEMMPDPKLPLGRAQIRRLVTLVVVASLGALIVPLGLHATPVDATTRPVSSAQEPPEREPVVDVVQISGFIDPVVADFLYKTIDDAEKEGIEALVVQLNSSRSVISDDELDALVKRVGQAKVPVAVWVGPSGAHAYRGAARLALAGDILGLAPRARIGKLGDSVPQGATSKIAQGTLGSEQALKAGISDLNQQEAAILGTFIAAIDGKHAAGRELQTATFREMPKGPPEATLTVRGRLSKLPLTSQLMHTASSPQVAYLLLLIGLMLVVFEFFTGGVGIAGGVGVVSLGLSAYGLAVLPTSVVGLALIVLSMFGFAVDVQTGVPRVWTAIGVLSLVFGSLWLFDDGIAVGWITLVAGVVGTVLMMLAGLPSTVRSRFSTPTIGRASLIGEMGEAISAIDPDGTVCVRGSLWKARTNRATPIALGEPVRIAAIEGLVLEVEPEEGAARDYREHRDR